MKTLFRHSILLALIALMSIPMSLLGQDATFIPNKGQWEGDFEYKTALSNGALFFDNTGWYALLINGEDYHSHDKVDHTSDKPKEAVNIRMQWLNANKPEITPTQEASYYTNYILGNDPEKWKSHIPVFKALTYNNIYPGISAVYYSQNGELKYDIQIKAGSDASKIKMKYEGVSNISINGEKLIINTKLGAIEEWIPEAYQWIGDKKKRVNCIYTLDNGEVGFRLGRHNPDYDVIIDPILIFSSFSGSIALNFGYTATYDNEGNFYGGGSALQVGFQSTPGVIQDTFAGGPMDVTISKFSKDGSNLLYATHLGGAQTDAPHSLNITPQNDLLILGNTDSYNFPTTSGAFQQNFVRGPNFSTIQIDFYKRGSNIFIAKLSGDGTQLKACTLFGDSLGDGYNKKIYKNYGDRSRGDILTLPNGNIAFTSSSLSKNLPLSSTGITLTGSGQKGIVAVFNAGLTQLVWGSYIGGSGNETGYSIKYDGTSLYVAGSTDSPTLSGTSGALHTQNQGGLDGYITKFNATNGSLIKTTFIGGAANDQCFFIDLDKDNKLYAHGQTNSVIPISANKYGTANAQQYVLKLDNNLSNLEWSTTVGTGTKSDWVPTAFMVDRCYNIYISGWNGASNTNAAGNTFPQNNTFNLPTSPDAFQDSTDGSDFYFMVLGKDAETFLFGSYFGGTSEEHVDGGTSRFSPDGIIYQAVCAGCFGLSFPTTPNAYSPTRPDPNKCNLGAIKIDFQQTVRSIPYIDPSAGYDTICDSLTVHFTNNSLHANKFSWDFGNGQTSDDDEPSTTYLNYGTYTVTLIAEDTICDISDTSTIVVVHTQGATVSSDFEHHYAGCDKNYEVTFTNHSNNANAYQWNFGDGTTSTAENPVHSFPDSGSYTVQLIAINTACQQYDTIEKNITFIDTLTLPTASVSYPECGNGKVEIKIANKRNRYTYSWRYDSKQGSGSTPMLRFSERGTYEIELTITDTICNVDYTQNLTIEIKSLTLETFVPNAFTPNGDGINDQFEISGESCSGDDYMRVYNRWGELIFETDDPFHTFWDGTYKGDSVPQGVYTFVLKVGKEVTRQHITLIR